MQGSVRKRGDKWAYRFDIGTEDGRRKQKEKPETGIREPPAESCYALDPAGIREQPETERLRLRSATRTPPC